MSAKLMPEYATSIATSSSPGARGVEIAEVKVVARAVLVDHDVLVTHGIS